MKLNMLAGAACAALMGIAAPAIGATPGYFPSASTATSGSTGAVDAFYARRSGAPLWLSRGPDSQAAADVLQVLRRAPLDGFQSGPALAAQASALLDRARAGDRAALSQADRLLSNAWVAYVQAIDRAPAGMNIADGWAGPRVQSADAIIAQAATASSLPAHVRSVSNVNPIYSQLRDAAWQQAQATGSAPNASVLASLDRARAHPFQKRYVMVDAASARLWMVENGQVVDSMKVIVGKPGAETQTPMLASTIYYATVNPYWHVTDELVRSLIAPNVMKQGLGYLSAKGYQVFDSYGDDAQKLDAAKIDWKAVAEGRAKVEVRQLPGPANSMGHMKFGFANKYDIYLHDTPSKELFSQSNRDLSHGCIRLEDAARLGRWLVGRDPLQAAANRPEEHVPLPTPVPIYITYLTAHADQGQLTFVDDIYGRDGRAYPEVAALR